MIDKIAHYSLTTPATVYDEEALTALELAARTAAKANEAVEQVNENTKNLPQMVSDDVQAHIDNGDFDAQVDKFAGDLTARVAKCEAETEQKYDDLEGSLGSRLDNLLSAVGSGSTSGDAELADLRFGADGQTYGSAGTAQRTQFEKVWDDIDRVSYGLQTGEMAINPATVIEGYTCSYNTGELTPDPNYFTSDYIRCEPNEDWSTYHTTHITVYDKFKNYLRGFVCGASTNYQLTFNTGADAAFIRVSKYLSHLNYGQTMVLGKGATMPNTVSYMQTLEGTVLDEKQFERKKYVEMLMEGKNPVHLTWERGGFDGLNVDVASDVHYRCGYFTIPANAPSFTIHNPDATIIWMVGTDEDHNRITALPDWTTDTEIVVDNTAAFYRIDANPKQNYNKRCTENITISYTPVSDTGKLGYTSGFTTFTVPVNQVMEGVGNDSESFVNTSCVIKLPTSYSGSGKPSPLVMFCHGAGRGVTGVDNWTTVSGYNALVNKFLNAGYVVFDCNGYRDDALGWNFCGAPRGLEAYRKAYDYITRNYNVTSDFSIFGFSMGGLTALNLAFNHMPNIKSIALCSPVVNLKEFCWDRDPGESAFTKAYGMNPAAYDADLVTGYDPISHIVNINGSDKVLKTLPPIKVWFGSLETGVNVDGQTVNKDSAAALVQAIRNGNGVAYYKEVVGADHSICYGNNPTVNDEVLAWIKRFSL